MNMDTVSDVIDYIRTVKGVLDVHEMDDEISNRLWDVERSVRTTNDNNYKNIGYDMAMERGHRLCVFYDDTYIFGLRSILKLMDSEGKILGTNLNPQEIEGYKDRDDVIWVSEDFIVFPYIEPKGEETFVLLPMELDEVEENVEGCRDAIATSPTGASDEMLKERFGKPIVKGMYTMIVAFDC